VGPGPSSSFHPVSNIIVPFLPTQHNHSPRDCHSKNKQTTNHIRRHTCCLYPNSLLLPCTFPHFPLVSSHPAPCISTASFSSSIARRNVKISGGGDDQASAIPISSHTPSSPTSQDFFCFPWPLHSNNLNSMPLSHTSVQRGDAPITNI